MKRFMLEVMHTSEKVLHFLVILKLTKASYSFYAKGPQGLIANF